MIPLRGDALSGSTDSDDVRLKRAVDKAIAAIDSSSGDLAADLKVASKALKVVTQGEKALAKATTGSPGTYFVVAKIDGQPFRSQEPWCRRDEISTYPSYSIAGARAVEGGIQSLEVYANGFGIGVSGPGTYDLMFGSVSTCSGATVDDIYCAEPITSAAQLVTGSITFEVIDESKKVVGGTFSFTAQKRIGGEGTVEVTEGRFFLKYVIGSTR